MGTAIIPDLNIILLSVANLPELVGLGHDAEKLKEQLEFNRQNYWVTIYFHPTEKWDGHIRESDFWHLIDIIDIPDSDVLFDIERKIGEEGWDAATANLIKQDSELLPDPDSTFIRRSDDQEFISFIQDVVGQPLSSWQKETLNHMRQCIAEGKPLDFSYRAAKNGRYQ